MEFKTTKKLRTHFANSPAITRQGIEAGIRLGAVAAEQSIHRFIMAMDVDDLTPGQVVTRVLTHIQKRRKSAEKRPGGLGHQKANKAGKK